MKIFTLIAVLVLSFSVQAGDDIYQIYEAKDGRVFSLNRQTGDMRLVDGSSLIFLSKKTVILKVGGYYEMEDGKKNKNIFLKYLGGGKFEKSKYAITSTW